MISLVNYIHFNLFALLKNAQSCFLFCAASGDIAQKYLYISRFCYVSPRPKFHLVHRNEEHLYHYLKRGNSMWSHIGEKWEI